ncbi:MAG TPA: hypothetical protein GX738_00510, partial [Firmicutes bacterium]|nr:hypothetical protein [Bacillota bacterium]
MKRIVAFLLCVLLVGSLMGEIEVVRAEEPAPQFAVTGYSVQGVLGVANTYAVTLHFKWNRSDLKSFTIAIDEGATNFKHVTSSYTIVS